MIEVGGIEWIWVEWWGHLDALAAVLMAIGILECWGWWLEDVVMAAIGGVVMGN